MKNGHLSNEGLRRTVCGLQSAQWSRLKSPRLQMGSMMDETLHPDRCLDIASTQNIRDLGGYSTPEGTATCWNRFVRSGDMDRLTLPDQQKLIDYGINTVIDLRMQREAGAAPNVFTGSPQVAFVNHDFWGDRFDDYRSQRKGAPAEAKLADLYCSGLVESGFIMADIMGTIANSSSNGFIFHCRSGKDRTGLVAALLLALAGVSTQTICADYALTASLLISTEADRQIDPNQPGYYLRGCERETMALTLRFLDEEYGGVEAYLQHLGVSKGQIRRIREKLLDK